MSQIVSNPTPQAVFQSMPKNLTEHRDMVASPAFDRGTSSAMLEYTRLVISKCQNANDSAAAGMKIQGALEFLQTFRMLAETPTRPKPTVPESLDYKS